MSQVELPSVLRQFSKSKSVVEVNGSTVAELLDGLDVKCPGIKARLVSGRGELQRYVNIFVDGDDIRYLQGLQTPVRPSSVISLLLAVAGG